MPREEKIVFRDSMIALKVEPRKDKQRKSVLTSSRGGYESSARLTTYFNIRECLHVCALSPKHTKFAFMGKNVEAEGKDITQREMKITRGIGIEILLFFCFRD